MGIQIVTTAEVLLNIIEREYSAYFPLAPLPLLHYNKIKHETTIILKEARYDRARKETDGNGLFSAG